MLIGLNGAPWWFWATGALGALIVLARLLWSFYKHPL